MNPLARWAGLAAFALVLPSGLLRAADDRIIASLRKGYDPALTVAEANIPDLVAFLGDDTADWQQRMVVAYALQQESFWKIVQEQHSESFAAAKARLAKTLEGVFSPEQCPALDVMLRLKGMWMTGRSGPTGKEWESDSFAAWLKLVDLTYDLDLKDVTDLANPRDCSAWKADVAAALQDGMAAEFPALAYYRSLGMPQEIRIGFDCSVLYTAFAEDTKTGMEFTHYYNKTIPPDIDEKKVAELVEQYQKLERKEADLLKKLDNVGPRYFKVVPVPFEYTMGAQNYGNIRQYVANRNAYEKAVANTPVQTFVTGSPDSGNGFRDELESVRGSKNWTENRIHELVDKKPSVVMDKYNYTRTKQTRTCTAQVMTRMLYPTDAGEKTESFSWTTEFSFNVVTWPGKPEVGLEGKDGALPAIENCRERTRLNALEELGSQAPRMIAREIFPWTYRKNRKANPSPISELEYQARGLLTFVKPLELREKWQRLGSDELYRRVERKQLILRILDGGMTRGLLEAATENDLDFARYLISDGADLNAKDQYGSTALNIAAAKGSVPIVELLLAQGADMALTDNEKGTPLHNAARNGRTPMVKLLMEKGADVNARNLRGATPLHEAAAVGNETICLLLLARVADPLAVDDLGQTALHLAAENGSVETVKHLLALDGIPVNQPRKNWGWTPLIVAAAGGHTEVVKILLAHGADVKTTDEYGATALHYAAGKGAAEIVKLLIAAAADVNARNKNGWTPLHTAAERGQVEVVRILLENKADPAIENAAGEDASRVALTAKQKDVANLLQAGSKPRVKPDPVALCNAIRDGNMELANLLLEAGTDVNGRDKWGASPLHYASGRPDSAMAEQLIQRKADVNSADDNGQTPLFYAAMGGWTDLVELLIRNGAQVNLTDKKGRSPIQVATTKNKAAVVKLLLSKGAETKADSNGIALLHLAAGAGMNDVITALLEKGENVNAPDKRGLTPLHFAAEMGRESTISLLLSKGADVKAKDHGGQTSLHSAVERSNYAAAELLLKKGSDPNTRIMGGWTPLHNAAYNDSIALVQLLLANGADPTLKCDDGQTAADLATKYNHPFVANVIRSHRK